MTIFKNIKKLEIFDDDNERKKQNSNDRKVEERREKESFENSFKKEANIY